jgi:Tfp pilus assembly protein PilN
MGGTQALKVDAAQLLMEREADERAEKYCTTTCALKFAKKPSVGAIIGAIIASVAAVSGVVVVIVMAYTSNARAAASMQTTIQQHEQRISKLEEAVSDIHDMKDDLKVVRQALTHTK